MAVRASVSVTSFLLGLVAFAPARAQAPAPTETPEIHAVFRVSKAFVDEVADRDIAAATPYATTLIGFGVSGLATGHGKAAVELLEAPGRASFAIHSHGAGETSTTGTRGRIYVQGRASGTFTATTYVRFDGRRFALDHTDPNVNMRIDVDRVGTRRDGPVGRALGRAAMRVSPRLIPIAERQGLPVAEQALQTAVADFGGKVTAELNEKLPVEESLNRVYPNTAHWVFQVSGTKAYLQAAYGPPEAVVPDLPANPKRVPNAIFEAWFRTTSKEAQLLAQMNDQPLAQQLIQKYLEATLPKLASLAEERSVAAIGPWVVISVARKAKPE